MAVVRIYNDQDFQSVNQIINAIMHSVSSDPSSPTDGQIWYRNDIDVLRLQANGVAVTLATGGGIANLVEDVTPQLGGMLDVNGNTIGDGTRTLIGFVEDGAAVNNIEVENEATGSGPIIRGTGADTNVDLNFETKGSGDFNFTGDITVTGTVDGRDIAADAANNDSLVTLTGVAGGSVDLGTFTGGTITDAQTIKVALQELETALEAITGATNLAIGTHDATALEVTSDTGTDVTLPTATTVLAGLMSAALRTKLDGIETAADVTDAANVNAAGAVMNSDTSTAAMGYVIDDDTMGSASATNLASGESIVAYIATQIAGFGRYQGGYDAATDSPSLDDGTPVAGIQAGDSYTVTVAGNFFTVVVEVGDLLIAETDGATLEAEWTVVNRNIDAASETVAGIVERATQAEVDAGSDTTRYVSPATLDAKSYGVAADCVAAAVTTVTHNLGTLDVAVQIVEVATGDTVRAFDTRTGINAVDVTINPVPAAGDFRILVWPIG